MSLPLTLPTERSAAVPGRIAQLDGLRAIAICAVLAAHILQLPLGWVGVDIFFVLSGFLITGILLARKRSGGGYFSYFYRRRIFRILPAYAVSIVTGGLLFAWWVFTPWPLFVFFGMNLQPLWWPKPAIIMSFWSLAVEEQFYLLWPIVILLVSETLLLRIALAAIVLTPILRVLCTPLFPSHFYIYMLTPFRADLLCAGAALALLWKDRTPRFEQLCRTRAWIGCAAGFGGLALLQAWPVFRLFSNTRSSNGLDYSLSLVGSVSLLAWTLADTSWLRKILSTRPMRYIGEISYTMYLIHLYVLVKVEAHVHSRALQFILVLAGTVLWASVSWFAMERPLIRFAARGGHSKHTATAA